MQKQTFEFKLKGIKGGSVSEAYGIPQDRADKLNEHFGKEFKAVTENQSESFNACELIESFCSACENDDEVHYANFCAGITVNTLQQGSGLLANIARMAHM